MVRAVRVSWFVRSVAHGMHNCGFPHGCATVLKASVGAERLSCAWVGDTTLRMPIGPNRSKVDRIPKRIVTFGGSNTGTPGLCEKKGMFDSHAHGIQSECFQAAEMQGYHTINLAMLLAKMAVRGTSPSLSGMTDQGSIIATKSIRNMALMQFG